MVAQRLAREFGLNRRTVKREVEAEEPEEVPQRAKLNALSGAQLAHVERCLAVCPSIRDTDLFGELQRDNAYAGSYATFQPQLRQIRPARSGTRRSASRPLLVGLGRFSEKPDPNWVLGARVSADTGLLGWETCF